MSNGQVSRDHDPTIDVCVYYCSGFLGPEESERIAKIVNASFGPIDGTTRLLLDFEAVTSIDTKLPEVIAAALPPAHERAYQCQIYFSRLDTTTQIGKSLAQVCKETLMGRVFENREEAIAAFKRSLQIKIRPSKTRDNVIVLDCSGKTTIKDGSWTLRAAIRQLLKDGKYNLLLNIGDVSYVDSSGISEFVSSYADLYREGGHLKFLNPTKRIQDLFTVTKLDKVFECFDSETEAAASFN